MMTFIFLFEKYIYRYLDEMDQLVDLYSSTFVHKINTFNAKFFLMKIYEPKLENKVFLKRPGQ